MANATKFRTLSSGHRYGADGYIGYSGTSGDESSQTPVGYGRNKRLSKRDQLQSGKLGVFSANPITSAKRPQPLRSYYTGIPTKRGSRPLWQTNGTGVPTQALYGVGYWYPNEKLDNEGVPITVWYFYDQNDGPHKDLRYGDKFRGTYSNPPFWVRRYADAEGRHFSDKEARDMFSDDHPDDNKVRVRGLTHGFRFITDLKPVRGENRPPKTFSGYSSASSGAATPARSFQSNPFRPGVSFAAAAGGFASGASSSAVSRSASPERFDSFINQSDGEGFTVVKKKKQKKPQQKSQAESTKLIYQQSMKGGVEPSEFYGTDTNGENTRAAIRELVGTTHYQQCFATITAHPDGYKVTYIVPKSPASTGYYEAYEAALELDKSLASSTPDDWAGTPDVKTTALEAKPQREHKDKPKPSPVQAKPSATPSQVAPQAQVQPKVTAQTQPKAVQAQPKAPEPNPFGTTTDVVPASVLFTSDTAATPTVSVKLSEATKSQPLK